MSDHQFDTILRAALLEAVERDWADVLKRETMELPETKFSPRYCRARARLLSAPFRTAQRAARPAWKWALRAAACFLLCAGIAFGGLMAFSPEARAWVVRVIIEWRETHTSYEFTGETAPESAMGIWRPSYIPEGFEETEAVEFPGGGHTVYENSECVWIDFTYMAVAQGNAFSHDNEHSNYYQITVGSYQADLYISDVEGEVSYLIWFNEDREMAYKLSSKINYQELITMAESVEKIN